MIAKEKLPVIDPKEIDRPHGRYTVELFDEITGKLKHREVRDNYITKNWLLYALGFQYSNPWFTYQLANNSAIVSPTAPFQTSIYSDRILSPFTSAPLPMDALILTTDPSSEDEDDAWLKGIMTAYATRWKATVPASGMRGQINESESVFSNNGNTHKTVWDFTTQQGNGVFQTLAIGSLSGAAATDRYWCGLGPQAILLDDSINAGGNASSGDMLSNPVFEGGVMYYLAAPTNNSSGSTTIVLRSLPEASVMGASAFANDPLVLNARGLTSTSVCSTGTTVQHPAGSGTQWPSGNSELGLVRLGSSGDFVMVWPRSDGNGNIGIKRFTISGTQVYTSQALFDSGNTQNGAGPLLSNRKSAYVAYDGTHLYVAAGGPNSVIRRVDPATGSVTATIDVGFNIQTGGGGLSYHGGNLYVGTSVGIIKVNVAGSLQAPYCFGFIDDASWSETAVSPFTGSQGPSIRTAGFVSLRGSALYGTKTTGYNIADFPRQCFFHGGKMWMKLSTALSAGTPVTRFGGGFIAVTGNNMFSRTVLDSPVTKGPSQNMKISYELTWPTGNDPAKFMPHPSI